MAKRILGLVASPLEPSPLCLLFSGFFFFFFFFFFRFFLCSPIAVCLHAARSSVCMYTRAAPPRTFPSPPPYETVPRRDRDAKETRAAFKLAATKRINSPGSLDLLIRAAVAFLRGLDRSEPRRLRDLPAFSPPRPQT